MKINETVTNVIGDAYKTWEVGQNILMDMAMGRGKTFFIVNVLGEQAEQEGKTILYLCNRSKLAEEVFTDINATWATNIRVKTYQSMQQDIEKNECIPFADYIVCDEVHYLLSDAWNDKTDVMYKWLMENKSAVKIFMSATGQTIFPIIEKWGNTIKYELKPDYSYIEKIVFYDDDLYINRAIDNLEENEKLLYFSRKIENAYEIYTSYKDMASFVCSNYTKKKEYKEYINKEALVKKGEKVLLSNKVTVTTSVWDNGINIKDPELRHIVCDFEDMVLLVQALGRKRVGKKVDGGFVLTEEDNIVLHIRKWSKQNLTQFVNPKRATFNEATKFLYRDKEWMEQQSFDRNKRINDCLYIDYQNNNEVEVNCLRYAGIEKEINRLEYGIKHGFDKQVLNCLGDSFVGAVEYISIKDEAKKSDLEVLSEYLESIVGEKLLKEDQQLLKSEFEKAGLKDRTMGINTLNGKLLDENIQYTIKAKKSGSIRYWMVLPTDME